MSLKTRLGWISGIILFCLGLSAAIWIQWGDWPNIIAEEKLENIDLVVVLGGGGLERPDKAFELYQRGVSRHLLVTGDGDIIYDQLLKLGVPSTNITHEVAAHSTWQNALFSGNKPEFQQAHRIVLVTTWFHGSRALAVFEKQFPEKTFFVSAEAPKYPLNQWQKGFRRRERYATIYYFLRYGVRPNEQRHPTASRNASR